jgi:hypothetical protein
MAAIRAPTDLRGVMQKARFGSRAVIAEKIAIVAKGRIARLRRSPREGPESAP